MKIVKISGTHSSLRSPVFLILSGICRKIPMSGHKAPIQLPTIFSTAPSKGETQARPSAVSGIWKTTPDVRAAGSNPLVHYLRFGADEGRRPLPPDGAATLKQSVAEAQREWDNLGR